MISDNENTYPKDKFSTVEKKQIRFQKGWNPEIQIENKSGKGQRKKSRKINKLISMKNNNISIFLLNCRSINNKLGEIKLLLYTRKRYISSLMKPGLTGLNQSSLTMFQYGNIEENPVEDLE